MKTIITSYLQLLAGFLTRIILGKHVQAIIARTNEYFFAIDPLDFEVGKRLRMKGKYADEEIIRLREVISPQSKILIVGAHIGTLAIPLSKFCLSIVAIEANPKTFELLRINIALNAVRNCKIINIAASEKKETIEFLLNTANSGGSKRIPKIAKEIYYYDNPEKILVTAYALDEYLKDCIFDTIIMDIEGSEFYALKGMQRILRDCKTLSIEFLPHHLKNVSEVSVEEFVSLISPHFNKMTIPSKEMVVYKTDFLRCLREMYESNQGDDAILFEKILS